jgi:hypothetical protein
MSLFSSTQARAWLFADWTKSEALRTAAECRYVALPYQEPAAGSVRTERVLHCGVQSLPKYVICYPAHLSASGTRTNIHTYMVHTYLQIYTQSVTHLNKDT